MSLTITLNGQPETLEGPCDLAALIERKGYGGMTVAVARNGGFVPKTAHQSTLLEEGDDIEIVAPMQGG
jgi:sulfur carrier protein